MPTDTHPPVHASPIKWTDDEWNKIVFQLYQLKGASALGSDGAEDIKARDVFEAQSVLPAERRRKQISIAQGFQQIRTRLRGLFEKGQQENLLPANTPASSSASHQDMVVTAKPASLDNKATSLPSANRDFFATTDAVFDEANNEADSPRTQEVRNAAAADVAPKQVPEVRPSGTAFDHEVAAARQSAAIAFAMPARPAVNVSPAPFLESRHDQSVPRAGKTATSLAELMRPFAAMVCEELAKALVQVFSEPETLSSISRLQAAAVGPARRSEEQLPRHDTQRVSNDNRPQRADIGRGAARSDAKDAQDEEVGQPMEVQPLFDPKLPPSANSDFKPTIGLVATRAHEYEGLQRQYPQLRFAIVPAEDIHGPEVFRDCQRVIGLREEVPQAIEDLLKRTLRYRYIWLRGGVDRVREQLDAWLANPGSMQAGPRSSAARGHKQAENNNAKKRAKWPPCVA